MTKLLLQHLLALAVSVLVGVLIAITVTDVLLPPAIPGSPPRDAVIVPCAAWIAGAVQVALDVAVAIRRQRKGSINSSAVATRTLFLTWGFIAGLSVVVGLLNEYTDWFN